MIDFKKYIPYGVSAIILLIASFYDYQITDYLYQTMPFTGMLFERFMLLPVWSLVLITFIILAIVKEKKYYHILALLTAFYIVYDVLHYWLPFDTSMQVLMLVVIALSYWLILWLLLLRIEKDCLANRLPFLTFFVSVFLTSIWISVVMKTCWGRIRYRELLSASQFVPWYMPCGITGHYSFPSGHTTMFTSIICLLEYKNYQFEEVSLTKKCLLWAFIIIMPITRMVMGAHFLSDTVVGFMITYSCYLGYRHNYRKRGLL